MKFNDAQSRAVMHNKGPCMVLAGPGSGKTTVIVNRIRYLTEELKVPPEKILVITFTRTAAEEMKERYRISSGGNQGVSFGTFHALFFKILRYAYHYDYSNILTEEERYRLLISAAGSSGISFDGENDFIAEISEEISRIKNGGELKKDYNPSSTDKESFFNIFREFEKMLRAEGKIDFDDMLLLTRRLFADRPEVLDFWREIYDYILIDEFQDVCPLQYELIKQVAYPKNNLFIVGDDDQSIYSFRGASPDIMLKFQKEFKSDKNYETITLNVNYRCAAEIVAVSSRLIQKNKKRFKKELKSGRKALFSTGTVRFRKFSEVKKEYEYVVHMIEDQNAKGIDYSELAVLYRTNMQPGSLISMLKEKNIPFTVRDAVPNIYEHWIAKNIFAYLELALMEKEKKQGMEGRDAEEAIDAETGGKWRRLFVSIANRPARYITRETMRREKLDFSVLYQENRGKAYVKERLDKLKYDLLMIGRLDLKASVKYIRKAVGYDDFLKKYASERSLDTDSLFGILDEIEASASGFDTYEAWKKHIEEYTLLLKQKQKDKVKEKETGVSLLTFHSAKGTEYDTVFIIDASENYTPYFKAGKPSEIEEERRMFYVAVTRAKNRLFILHSEERFGRSYEESRFIKDMG